MTIHKPSSAHSKSLDLVSLKNVEESIISEAFRSMLVSGNTLFTDQILHLLSCKVSNFWGYEIRLAKENPADLLICISKANKEHLLQNLQDQSFGSTQWQHVSKIIELWCNRQDPLSDEMSNIWLEFDQNDRHMPDPNFFFAPNPTLNGKSLRNVYSQLFNNVLNLNLDTSTLNKFESVCNAFPFEAWAPQVGMMLARNYTNIRLYIHQMPAQHMMPYLKTIGWAYANSDFESLYKQLLQFTPCIDLDLDINQHISAPIGLECYFTDLTIERLDSFLEFLLKRGYACETMCTKLLYFFKESSAIPHAATYREFLHHIKISYNPLGTVEAKVYLGIRKNNY